jgi:uncharacterized protein (DUF1684 family)
MPRSFKFVSLVILMLASAPIFGLDRDKAQTWTDQLQQWRAERAANLTAPGGWLSVVALDWLKYGDNTVGTSSSDSVRLSGAGGAHYAVIHVEENSLRLKAPAGGFPSALRVDGHPAQEQAIVADGPNATKFTAGTLTFFVIRRGDRFGVRVKDSQAPARLGFHGLNWFPPNPQYRIEADWVPYPQPKEVGVQNVIGIVTKGLVPGVAKFTIAGHDLALEPVVDDLNEEDLMFVIRDATSGRTTYAASRFLHAGLPDHGLLKPGKLLLDFNRLENPPCAFTAFATCPLPLENNRLKVALEAGEKIYEH